MVVGLFTGLLNHGGVERMGRQLAVVLGNYAKKHGQSYRMLSLNDPEGEHEIQVEDLLIVVHGCNRNKSLFVWEFAKLLFKLRLLLLAHPHFAPLVYLVRVLRSSIPCHVVTYGIDVWEPLPMWHRLALQISTMVITISRFSSTKLVEMQGVKPDKISLLPPAVEKGFLTQASRPTDELPKSTKSMRLLTVSRLSTLDSYKGIDVVIRALPQVLAAVPHVLYYIVGDGDDRSRLERLVQDGNIKDQVSFQGKVSDSELQKHYQTCDVFVMPSLNEGFGIVFLEAMACYKPVVGGNHAGAIDVIHDGETGCLVTYGDKDELANCLVRLLKDEDLRKRLGEAGRHTVETQFSFMHFKEIFFRLLNKHAY